MKLIFVSNYFNHHQLPFCDALYELLEGDFSCRHSPWKKSW